MLCGSMLAIKVKKSYPETDESGQFWHATMMNKDTRLRAARGIAKTETEASVEVFHTLKRRGHPEAPPPTISDGWGGIDDAMIEVYGKVPDYPGWGRPFTRKRPLPGWKYLQMVKQREDGRVVGIKLRAIFGQKSNLVKCLGTSTAYIERSHLTARLFNSRLTRKTLAFSKSVDMYRSSVIWEDAYYNLVRPHKSLRLEITSDPSRRWLPRTPAVASKLTDHIWTVKELLYSIPINTC